MDIVIFNKLKNSSEFLHVFEMIETDSYYLISYKRDSDNKFITSYRSKSLYIISKAHSIKN